MVGYTGQMLAPAEGFIPKRRLFLEKLSKQTNTFVLGDVSPIEDLSSNPIWSLLLVLLHPSDLPVS